MTAYRVMSQMMSVKPTGTMMSYLGYSAGQGSIKVFYISNRPILPRSQPHPRNAQGLAFGEPCLDHSKEPSIPFLHVKAIH